MYQYKAFTGLKHDPGIDYITVDGASKLGIPVQTLTNGFKVSTLKTSGLDVVMNGDRVISIAQFHSLGGIVALFPET